MFGSVILDVAIGLALIYVLLSIIASAVQEWLASYIFKFRSKDLKAGIERLLSDPVLVAKFFDHPLIKSLAKGDQHLPSYIPSSAFSTALLDITGITQTVFTTQGMKNFVSSLSENDSFKQVLSLLIDETTTTRGALQQNIEKYFDDAMERVSGWYKRKTQLMILVISAVIAVGINVDSLKIANSLYHDSALRAGLVAAAEQMAKEPLPASGAATATIEEINSKLTSLNLPIGWETLPSFQNIGLNTFIGWLITALAISLGAPFWFDLLGKLVNLRSGGTKPQKTTGDSVDISASSSISAPLIPPSRNE